MRFTALSLVACGCVACAGELGGGSGTTDGGTDAASVAREDAAVPPPADPVPDPPPPLGEDFACDGTLESIRATIFARSCYWDTCHSENGAALGLRLVGPVDSVYDKLVDVPTSCKDAKLVVPGDPDASYLMEKLTQDPPTCGARMPWGYQTLPPAALDCIRAWILSL